jgi:hypothetical protein
MFITRSWKASLMPLLALGAALALALAVLQPASANDNGRVRIMHASPDTPAVDIFVNGQKAIDALAFPEDTGYIELPAGTYNVEVYVSPSDGSGDPALQADLTIAAGTDYTVLATGLLADGSLGLLPLQDNNATPAAGNAHVRLIHASADAPAVDVLVAGTTTKVFSNVEFNAAQGPNPVPAGTYDLQVQVAPDGPAVLDLPGIALSARTVYTVVAIGLAGDGSLTVKALVDAAAPATAPDAPHTGTGMASTSGSLNAMWLALAGAVLATVGAAGLVAARRR